MTDLGKRQAARAAAQRRRAAAAVVIQKNVRSRLARKIVSLSRMTQTDMTTFLAAF